MVNHVNILIYPEAKLSHITKGIKNFSASSDILGKTNPTIIWAPSPEELEKIVKYIEENPVAAGLVERVEDWRWSSI